MHAKEYTYRGIRYTPRYFTREGMPYVPADVIQEAYKRYCAANPPKSKQA